MNPPEVTTPPDERARQVVHAALADVEVLLPPGTVLTRDSGGALAAPDGPLGSLGLVNLVVALDNHTYPDGSGATTFLDALALPLEESPFRTVASLEAFVLAALQRSAG